MQVQNTFSPLSGLLQNVDITSPVGYYKIQMILKRPVLDV